MTKLPQKDLLSGAKTPRTTTGEMKNALGKLRDFLSELFGEDSSDKEAVRKTLGIDLTELTNKIEAKADQQTIQTAIQNKADKTELENRTAELEQEIAKRGAPAGTIEYFALAMPPAGYLIANGAEVGRGTYPDLFEAIGTIFGEGDGETTFNLPDLIGRFPQGSLTPGQKILAGLPNIEGKHSVAVWAYVNLNPSGCFHQGSVYSQKIEGGTGTYQSLPDMSFDASRSNSIYGASNTVQPPALTLLPCIKVFDAVSNPGLINVTELANEVEGKLDKTMNGKPVQYVTDAYCDGRTGGWRKWSDGLLEQWGELTTNTSAIANGVFYIPFSNPDYYLSVTSGITTNTRADWYMQVKYGSETATGFTALGSITGYVLGFRWYACGQGI